MTAKENPLTKGTQHKPIIKKNRIDSVEEWAPLQIIGRLNKVATDVGHNTGMTTLLQDILLSNPEIILRLYLDNLNGRHLACG